jgi:hypothetical protein
MAEKAMSKNLAIAEREKIRKIGRLETSWLTPRPKIDD